MASDKNKNIIFIVQRKGIVTGGGKMDLYLWNLSLQYNYRTSLIELDTLNKRLPFWIIKLFNICYFLKRVGRIISYLILIQKKRDSIIYLSSLLLNELYLYLLTAKLFYNAKIIVYVHLVEEVINDITDNRIKGFFKNKIIHFADIILTNSNYTKRKLISYGIADGRIIVIYPLLLKWPVNCKSRLENRRDKIILLFIGTEFIRKGLKYLLEALIILDRHDVFLNIVGNGDKEVNLRFIKDNRDLIEKLETKNMIKLLGEVTEVHCKDELFAQADIFVMPSLSEGFGIVFAEAMAYNLPIIAADTTAIPELVKEGFNGILVPPEDSKALAKAIETLADDKALRIEMGDNGYKKIKDFYDSYSIDKEFRSVLESLSM